MYGAVFGSHARDNFDQSSDFDVILIFEDGELDYKEQLVERAMKNLPQTASISKYSCARIKQLWSQGSPFAWHLYLESRPLEGFECGILKSQPPSDYSAYCDDIGSMREILSDSVSVILRGTESIIYEAGIVYVCARNIAMFASMPLLGQFDFSRYAPYVFVEEYVFPLTRNEYEMLVHSRLRATRGIRSMEMNLKNLPQIGIKVLDWACKIESQLQRGGVHERHV